MIRTRNVLAFLRSTTDALPDDLLIYLAAQLQVCLLNLLTYLHTYLYCSFLQTERITSADH